jgi:hypothetical protein
MKDKKFNHLIDKKILKAYELLKIYVKKNKFKKKKVNSFIYVYLLYIQNNYDLDFHFKDQSKEKTLYKCLKSLYSDLSRNKAKKLLFSDEDFLLDLFVNDKKLNSKKFLHKLTDAIYSNSYISINIQLLDYLGNNQKDIDVINSGLCLIFFKELYPDIEIEKGVIKHMVKTLCNLANITNNTDKNKNIIKYTNTHAILLLILLGKLDCVEDLKEWIQLLMDNQMNNGKWNNGFNSYFASDPENLDLVHTAIGLIVLLEYKVHLQHKVFIEYDKNIDNKNETDINDENKYDDENIEEKNKKSKNITMEEKNELIEKFSNIENNKYELNFNIYNISLTVITLLLAWTLLHLNKKFKK